MLFVTHPVTMYQASKAVSPGWPPSTADMIHELVTDQKSISNTRRLVQPQLDRLQMSWEAEVEDVYPIIGISSFFMMKEFPNPHKTVYMTSLTDPNKLVAVLKTAFESWSTLRSIAVEYDKATRLLVMLRATQRYIDRAISMHVDVEDEQSLMEMPMCSVWSFWPIMR